ncbi:hypothetical protein LJC24_01605 [Desulfococcaceae bacterium OttesenSCG-928-F15]|nr:hypothetical protein [Desulfococcaceae bacterium OttesenSCG-928-F15]
MQGTDLQGLFSFFSHPDKIFLDKAHAYGTVRDHSKKLNYFHGKTIARQPFRELFFFFGMRKNP